MQSVNDTVARTGDIKPCWCFAGVEWSQQHEFFMQQLQPHGLQLISLQQSWPDKMKLSANEGKDELIRFWRSRSWSRSQSGQIFVWIFAAGGGIHIDACPSKYHLVYLLGRPNGRPYVLLSPRNRAPSADRRETLPHDRNMDHLYNVSPKIRGPCP